MSSKKQPGKVLGLFGGTFDPIHNGHIAMAAAAQDWFALDRLYLLPCHQPPHRSSPQLSSQQRLKLLSLAIAGKPGMEVDDRELRRDGPSYTVDTLKSVREQWGPEHSLVLLMGADAYNDLTSWHQWQHLLDLSHIGVFVRPGYTAPQEGLLADYLAASPAAADAKEAVRAQAHGVVFALQQDPVALSATAIRQQLATGQLPEGLPTSVKNYISQYQLYGYRP